MSRVRKTKQRQVFSKGVEFFSTGCAPLDCVMGGGYAMMRMSNIIGDKSSGKTLLAMEAFANFLRLYPKGICKYYEIESAWDDEYVTSLGIPVDAIQVIDDVDTGEEFADTFEAWLNERIGVWDQPALAIIDSWDALTSKQEQDQKSYADGTFGMGKSKLSSTFFRKVVRKMRRAGVTLIVISQVRDNINAGAFGKKYRRNGGKALDFYASQILWIAEKGKINVTKKGIKRPIGIDVVARTDKNKVGLPFRQCDMPLFFGYGIDDIAASITYLKAVSAAMPEGMTAKERDKFAKGTAHMDLHPEDVSELREDLHKLVFAAFEETETQFLPVRSKY